MRTGCMFFLSGIVALCCCPQLPPAYLACLLPFCFLLGYRFPVLVLPCWLFSGFLWALFRADIVLEHTLPVELEGKTLTIEGVIADLPKQLEGGHRFIFRLERVLPEQHQAYQYPEKILLSWYGNTKELVPGDHWRLRVRLKQANGFMNPGSFDYEAWLFQQRITASGYVSRKRGNVHLRDANRWHLNRLRYLMRVKLQQVLQGYENGSLVPALVLGDRSEIKASQWQVLSVSGTSHLLAISGLHIGLVAGLVFYLTRCLWPLAWLTALLIPAPRIAAITAMLAAFCYAAMAGFSIPTQRALVMLVVLFTSTLLGRKMATSSIIFMSLLLVLIIDPLSVLSAGFWLSFTAVAVITFGMSSRVHSTGLWWRWGRVQYLVAAGLFPLLVYYFNRLPLFSIAANLIVVPWVSFVTVPLVLLGSASIWFNEPVGIFLLQRGADSINVFWPALNYIGQVEIAVFDITATGKLAFLSAVIGVILLLMPAGLPGRWLGLVWILPVIFPVRNQLDSGELHLTLLDVGQGLAVVANTSNHRLLFDTGPRFSSHFDAGSAVIIPFLSKHDHPAQLDLLIQSHGDNDHIGGLAAILEKIEVEKVLTSVPDRIEHDNVHICQRGQTWNWDGISFEILHPAAASELSGNERSCVLKIRNFEHSILLTGDIEDRAERRLLLQDRIKLASTVLLAPHHGSRTSSTRDFIEAVGPEYVLFATGYRNRFGFPKQDIIQRYQEIGATILNTAESGAITIKLDRSGVSVNKYREDGRGFWNRAGKSNDKLQEE